MKEYLQFEWGRKFFFVSASPRKKKLQENPLEIQIYTGEIFRGKILTVKTINFRKRNIVRDKKDFKNCINFENATTVINSPEVKFTGGSFNAFIW